MNFASDGPRINDVRFWVRTASVPEPGQDQAREVSEGELGFPRLST